MRILTFDIEEWFHILDNDSTRLENTWRGKETRIHRNMDRIFELLDKHNQRATFFCIGWVAEKHPDVIKKIDALGYEIGSHSNLHQLVYEQSPEEFRQDLRVSIDRIESVTGKKITKYRSPGFSITKDALWAFEILSEEGIVTDCSVFPASRAHGGIADLDLRTPFVIKHGSGQLREFPVSVTSMLGKNIIFSGGGYFRFFPYKVIKRLTSKEDYVMTYFHPRDFDPAQPMIKELPLSRKFKSYVGLKGALGKLDAFLRDYRFMDVAEAEKMIDWEGAGQLEISRDHSGKNGAFSVNILR